MREIGARPARIDPLAHARRLTAELLSGMSCATIVQNSLTFFNKLVDDVSVPDPSFERKGGGHFFVVISYRPFNLTFYCDRSLS